MTRARGRRPRRPSTPGLVACAALLACLAAGSLVLLFRGSGGGTPAGPKPTLAAKATLSSRSVLFGDTVEARLDVILPRGTRQLRLQASFSPFRIVSRNVDRANLGDGLERISLRYGLRCLSSHCVGSKAVAHVQFGPTLVSIPGRTVRAAWPPLVQVSRLRDVSTPVTDGLAVGPPVPPGLQPRRDTFEAFGAAAASLAVLLVAWLYVRRRVQRRLALAAHRESLLQALLARVEAGLPEDVVYRQRHALDALAVELRHRRIDGSLAFHAQRLAWAPEQPNPEEIRSLCIEIRRMVKA